MATVLIIDDAKFMRLTLSNIFEKYNYSVVGTAKNGEEGLNLYKETNPDLVTLDITMPVMDGIQTLSEIMAYDEQANVVMCSAMGQQRLVVKAIELGAKDFIVKPFNEEKVIHTVNQILQSSNKNNN